MGDPELPARPRSSPDRRCELRNEVPAPLSTAESILSSGLVFLAFAPTRDPKGPGAICECAPHGSELADTSNVGRSILRMK